MKPKKYSIPEDRILDLSNDLSEGIQSGTKKEWIACAEYWRYKFDGLHKVMQCIRSESALAVVGVYER